MIISTSFCHAQNIDIQKGLELISNEKYLEATINLKNIDTSGHSTYDKALWSFYLGYSYNFIDEQDKAYLTMIHSKTLFNKINKIDDVKDCNLQLLKIVRHQNNLKIDTAPIIKELEDYIKYKNDPDPDILFTIYLDVGSTLLKTGFPIEARKTFEKSYQLSKSIKDSLQMAFDNMNLGSVYKDLGKYETSLSYTKAGLPYLLKIKDTTNIAYNYNNQAEAYKYLKNYDLSKLYFQKAHAMNIKSNKTKSKIIFYENMADLYAKENEFKLAYQYQNKYKALSDSINDKEQDLKIQDYKTKYQTAEKEKEILRLSNENLEIEAKRSESEAKRKENQNLAIGLGGSLALGSIIAFLIFKNTKRKQKLAEQEKVLESQKLATVLKEQELKAIDAMIEGQEKERQRIANDLHDDLGGLMATVKLHFNALKDKDSPELYEKTNNLIEEAYQKVRSVAHAKNSGVIAKQGLLKAVRHMAEKISASNEIQIDVLGHGLDNRLENSLELTSFRIIQELITNVIKHAEASEATIHLTNHEDSINIMVEDNGKGFNPSQVTKTKKGMGISSIDKRVEHLDGKLTIESEKNKGTTVIIDIPL